MQNLEHSIIEKEKRHGESWGVFVCVGVVQKAVFKKVFHNRPKSAETQGKLNMVIGTKLDASPANVSVGVGGNKSSIFIGPEINFAVGMGIRAKIGISINPQPNLTSFEKLEKAALVHCKLSFCKH